MSQREAGEAGRTGCYRYRRPKLQRQGVTGVLAPWLCQQTAAKQDCYAPRLGEEWTCAGIIQFNVAGAGVMLGWWRPLKADVSFYLLFTLA